MKINYFLLCFIIVLVTEQLSAQNGSAVIYLKTDSVLNISVNQVRQSGILDSYGTEIPFDIIDSLTTPDNSIAYEIQGYLTNIEVIHRNKTYFIDMTYLFPSPKVKTEADELSISTENLARIKLLDGTSIEGKYLSSTDSTATYQTSYGNVTIKKSLIFSIHNISNTPNFQPSEEKLPNRKILVKEYNKLPLLIVTIAGGAWAISLFNDASDFSSAADAFEKLGLGSLAAESNDKASSKTMVGLGVSAASLFFLIWAVTPSETYIEQPISIIPTLNGLQFTFRF